jgi:hypothetical protein
LPFFLAIVEVGMLGHQVAKIQVLPTVGTRAIRFEPLVKAMLMDGVEAVGQSALVHVMQWL